jgi:predicted NBD/HSP70 family sugar kinase
MSFGRRLGCPIDVENRATAAALAEQLYGENACLVGAVHLTTL